MSTATTTLTTPFWFKQRQCKAEPHEGGVRHLMRVTGPNLGEAFIYIQEDNGRWTAGLRTAPDGPDVATAVPEEQSERAAWEVAFELYRDHVII